MAISNESSREFITKADMSNRVIELLKEETHEMYRQNLNTQQKENNASSLPEPETNPPSGVLFQTYLQTHHLTPLEVALTSGVRYATVWNIAHTLPVRPAHAALVRAALQRLTGIPYTAPIALLPPSDQRTDGRKDR